MLLILKNGKELGEIDFVDDNTQFNDVIEEDLKKKINEASLSGVLTQKDFYNEGENKFTLVERKVFPGDELFPLALKNFLILEGYQVIEKHPEIEEEIKKLLISFPDDNEDKKDILNRLTKMTHLEQTLLLRELKKID